MSVPSLWKHLDLTRTAKGPINTAAIRSYIQNAGSDITSIIIGYLSDTDVNPVMNLVCDCPSVRELDIQSFRFRGSPTVETLGKLPHSLTALKISRDCAVAADSALSILQEFRHLERVEFVCSFAYRMIPPPIPDAMPHMRSLSLCIEEVENTHDYLFPFVQVCRPPLVYCSCQHSCTISRSYRCVSRRFLL